MPPCKSYFFKFSWFLNYPFFKKLNVDSLVLKGFSYSEIYLAFSKVWKFEFFEVKITKTPQLNPHQKQKTESAELIPLNETIANLA